MNKRICKNVCTDKVNDNTSQQSRYGNNENIGNIVNRVTIRVLSTSVQTSHLRRPS